MRQTSTEILTDSTATAGAAKRAWMRRFGSHRGLTNAIASPTSLIRNKLVRRTMTDELGQVSAIL